MKVYIFLCSILCMIGGSAPVSWSATQTPDPLKDDDSVPLSLWKSNGSWASNKGLISGFLESPPYPSRPQMSSKNPIKRGHHTVSSGEESSDDDTHPPLVDMKECARQLSGLGISAPPSSPAATRLVKRQPNLESPNHLSSTFSLALHQQKPVPSEEA